VALIRKAIKNLTKQTKAIYKVKEINEKSQSVLYIIYNLWTEKDSYTTNPNNWSKNSWHALWKYYEKYI